MTVPSQQKNRAAGAACQRFPALRWLPLVALSALFSLLLTWCHMPAAWLLGPLLAGIVVALAGTDLKIPARPFVLAQALIGCMIATMLPASLAGEVGRHWPLFIAGVLPVIALSGALGWLMTRMRLFPGTTAVWGLSPGAATAMIVMAEAYGADVQLVALMQYLRVVLVTAVAALVTSLGGGAVFHAAASSAWSPPRDGWSCGATLALVVAGPVLAKWTRFSAGALLYPLFAGMLLQNYHVMTIAVPPWLVAAAYAVVGWRIGLRFTRPLLLYAARALPRLIGSTLLLIVACGGLAALLVRLAGIDPLTAYLATSPGGADSVALIAAVGRVDAKFVMAMQMVRFACVLVLGPPMARLIAAHAGRAGPA